jgi:hypothetical protein
MWAIRRRMVHTSSGRLSRTAKVSEETETTRLPSTWRSIEPRACPWWSAAEMRDGVIDTTRVKGHRVGQNWALGTFMELKWHTFRPLTG